jgi:hypothetical protein
MCEVVEWIGLVAAVLFCLAVVGIDITLIRLVVLVWLS